MLTVQVSTEQGQAYAVGRGIGFLEASALTASNVEASFLQVALLGSDAKIVACSS